MAFRKFKYRLAVLNESHYGDPGIEILIPLIAENPRYDRYHLDLRWMLRNHLHELKFVDDGSNPLTAIMLDENVDECQFLYRLRKERGSKTDVWLSYRKYVSRLKLPASANAL